ncbi:MAG: molybdate ABC transporter permease subunit [Clostridiales bacterium]|nr:molybdate ABC transporter permease subunit [Clostridiales bacterium]
MDLFPLCNSIRISLIATAITLALGILCAYHIARLPGWIKGIMDTFLTIPMVLPPTVVGYLILVTTSPKSALGSFLKTTLSTTITMKWYAAVIAVVIVTFPLMYRTVRSAFESFDENLLHAGRTLGLSNSLIFRRILLPNCRSGILAGIVLSFARGIGEYGATSMVAGYIAGKTATVSTTVAYYWQTNQDDLAMRWVLINLSISFAVMLTVNYFDKKNTSSKRRQSDVTLL